MYNLIIYNIPTESCNNHSSIIFKYFYNYKKKSPATINSHFHIPILLSAAGLGKL